MYWRSHSDKKLTFVDELANLEKGDVVFFLLKNFFEGLIKEGYEYGITEIYSVISVMGGIFNPSLKLFLNFDSYTTRILSLTYLNLI